MIKWSEAQIQRPYELLWMFDLTKKVYLKYMHHISAQFYFIKCNFVFFSNECPSLCQHRPGHSFHIAKLGSFNYISQAFVVHILFKFWGRRLEFLSKISTATIWANGVCGRANKSISTIWAIILYPEQFTFIHSAI